MEPREMILHSKEAIEYTYTWVITNYDRRKPLGLLSPVFETNVTEVIGAVLKPQWDLKLKENKDIRFLDICLSSPFGIKPEKHIPDATPMYIIFSVVTKQGEEVNRQEKFVPFSFDDSYTRLFEKFLHKDYFLDEKNGLLVNGECTIRCRLYFFPKPNKTVERIPGLHLINKRLRIGLDNFEKLMESGSHSDVRLIVQDKEFHVHKCILAAQSRVFSAMFEHEMRESNENVVNITDVKIEAMEELLRFIYASRVKNIKPIVKSLLAAADKYEIQELKAMCEKVILKSINMNNVGELLALADTYKARNLKTQATMFMIRHRSSVNGENLKEITKSVSYSVLELINLFNEYK